MIPTEEIMIEARSSGVVILILDKDNHHSNERSKVM